MIHSRLAEALSNLVPNIEFSINGDDYNKITILNNEFLPSRTAIQNELYRLDKEYSDNKYQRDRKKEYMPLDKQLDMLYWDFKNNTTNWITYIDSVKQQFPKNN